MKLTPVVATILGGLAAVWWPGSTAEAGSTAYGCNGSAKYCLVADACKVDNPICGAIVYTNKGGYDVTSERMNDRSDQPATPTIHSACSGGSINLDSTGSVALGQFIQWVLPASCAYHLKINIVAGPKKDRNLFLTPGCVIETSTDGTTISNEWHMKVYWSDKAKNQGASGDVIDPAGNNCGRLNKM